MADSVVRLTVNSQEYDQKLKRATEGLQRYVEGCRKVGGTLAVVEKDTLEYVKALGRMETTSHSASGKLSEMRKTFVELSMQYKQLTDQEKNSQFGQALNASLQQLKGRINETKNQLADVNKELNLSDGKFGEFGNVIDTLGSKLGISGNLTEMLTSKTAMLTGAVGAGIAIVTKATEAWAAYNAELAKQDQITTVTTGLKGDAADKMTDQARALADTYNVDFREAINAANTLMTQFGETGEQSMQLIKDGMQGMIQGDGPKLLSMIQQYAPAFRDAGVSASQLVAVIQNSEGGIFTDQNMNAIVMGIKNIRLMTKATSDALAQLGIDGEKMSRQLSDGSMTIFDALKQVAGAIQNVDSNSKAAGEVMQQVFGRQGVTAGTNLGKAIETLNTNLAQTKKQTGEVGEALADLQTANEKLNKAIRDCFEYDGWDQMAKGIQANLVTALATVLDYIGKIKGSLTDFVGGAVKAGEQPKPDPKYKNGTYWESKDEKGNVTSGRYWNNQQVSLAEYEKRKKAAETPIQINKPTKGGNNIVFAADSIMAQEKLVQELTQKWKTASAEMKGGYLVQLNDAKAKLDEMIKGPDLDKLFPDLSSQKYNTGTASRGDALMQSIRADMGRENMAVDQASLKNIMTMAMKEGLDTSEIDANGLLERIFNGEDIPTDFWNGLMDRLNEALQDFGREAYDLDEKGNLKQRQKQDDKKEKKADKEEKKYLSEGLSQLSGGLNGLQSGFSQLGIDLGEGFGSVVQGLSGISSILMAIQTIVGAIEAISAVDSIIPFAGGGIVKAAGGTIVGNSYSGDNLRGIGPGGQLYGLNAGEVVLNRSQVGNLASQLSGGGMQNLHLETYLDGRAIRIVLNNESQGRLKGKYVTSQNLRG